MVFYFGTKAIFPIMQHFLPGSPSQKWGIWKNFNSFHEKWLSIYEIVWRLDHLFVFVPFAICCTFKGFFKNIILNFEIRPRWKFSWVILTKGLKFILEFPMEYVICWKMRFWNVQRKLNWKNSLNNKPQIWPLLVPINCWEFLMHWPWKKWKKAFWIWKSKRDKISKFFN